MTATAPPTRPFEPVFDSQSTFRVVLDAMARPGKVGLLTATDSRCPLPGSAGLAAVAQTLLDHEVTFAVMPGLEESETAFTRYLAATTGSRPVSIAEADYVFAGASLAPDVLTTLKRGSLAFPDEGATLLLLVNDIEDDSGVSVTMTGPGIPGTKARHLSGLGTETLAERRTANAEIPRGVDLLLVDTHGRVLGLPRTTQITATEAKADAEAK